MIYTVNLEILSLMLAQFLFPTSHTLYDSAASNNSGMDSELGLSLLSIYLFIYLCVCVCVCVCFEMHICGIPPLWVNPLYPSSTPLVHGFPKLVQLRECYIPTTWYTPNITMECISRYHA
jgi:hypothetical protein